MSDSLQTVLQFPCTFPLKAMGYNTDAFESVVIEIVRRHVPDLDADAISSRVSAGSKYRSVTATFTAHSREQLDALYSELSSHEQILMVL
jgi:putative lipoic acid-binding regulatory protein